LQLVVARLLHRINCRDGTFLRAVVKGRHDADDGAVLYKFWLRALKESAVKSRKVMTETAGHVFLSYSRRDAQFALRLATDLHKAGIMVWVDQREIAPGERWDNAVQTALAAAPTVIVLLSPASCTSTTVMDEVSFALNKGKRIIPLRHQKCDIPFRLERLQWIDITDDYEGGVKRVVNTLNKQEAHMTAAAIQPLVLASSCETISVDPWNPALPPMFVGRAVLLKKLCGAWEQGRSVSLVGDWRIGKTSILVACYERLGKSGRPVRLLRGKSQEGTSPCEFVKAATGISVNSDSDKAADVLAQWARQERRVGLVPLLLVDEGDVLARRFEYRFFERLRGMMDDLCLGVSSRRELDRVFKDVGKGASPFQNRLELHWVGLLEQEAADHLIEYAGAGLSPRARQSVREWAGRHPFFIQLMTRKLLDAPQFGQTADEAFEEFQTEASARLRELWGTLNEREQQILVEAATNPTPNAALRRRGLIEDQGRPFGRVLTQWLLDGDM